MYISQGIVAKLGVVGYLLATLLQIFRRICRWKIFWKSANYCRRYGQMFAAYFFGGYPV